jgi:Domain of unknown function (DUF4389)
VTDIPAGPPVSPPPLQPAPPLPPPYQGPAGAAPIEVGFAGSAEQRRLTVLVRLILIIPQLLFLILIGIAAEIVLILGWFGALFTGRLPEFAVDFLSGVLRWQARVNAYYLLLTDQYPPFSLEDANYPVRVAMHPGPLNRLAVLFRFILVIPASIVAGVVTYGLETISLFVIWLIVLITGRMPQSLYEAVSAVLRYSIRLSGYTFLLTSEYPRGLFGDPPMPGGLPGAAPYPAGGYPGGGYPAAPGFASAAGSAPPPTWPPADGGPQVGGTVGYQQVSGTGPAPASDAPIPAWGQTVPTGSAPAYGTPADAGYAAPPAAGYGAPPTASYAAPTTPGYGTQPIPAYGTQPIPAYGAPATVSKEGWLVPGSPPWPLVLSQGAKRLVGLFIALGVIIAVAYFVIFAVVIGSTKTATRAAALSQSAAAFSRLSTSLTTFGTQTTACKGSQTPLPCVTAADRQASSAFATYASTQGGIGMPTSSSLASSTLLVADATRAQQVFQQLADSKSVAQYEKTVNGSNLQQVLNQLELTYRQLQTKLASG